MRMRALICMRQLCSWPWQATQHAYIAAREAQLRESDDARLRAKREQREHRSRFENSEIVHFLALQSPRGFTGSDGHGGPQAARTAGLTRAHATNRLCRGPTAFYAVPWARLKGSPTGRGRLASLHIPVARLRAGGKRVP